MCPVVIRHTPVVLPDRQRELNNARPVEPLQPKEISEHVNGLLRLLKVIHLERVEGVAVDVRQRGHRIIKAMLHLISGTGVMVAQHFQGHSVFLLGAAYLIVELCVMES